MKQSSIALGQLPRAKKRRSEAALHLATTAKEERREASFWSVEKDKRREAGASGLVRSTFTLCASRRWRVGERE